MGNKNREVLIETLHGMEDFAELKGLKCPPIYLLDGSDSLVFFRVRESIMVVSQQNEQGEAGQNLHLWLKGTG